MKTGKKETETPLALSAVKAPKGRHSLMLVDLFRYSLRVFKTRLSRTLLTILGISIGTGIVLLLVSLGYGLQFTLIGRLVTTEDSLITIEAYYPPDSGLAINSARVDKLRVTDGVGEVSPVASVPAEISISEELATTTAPTKGFLLARIVDPGYFRLSGVTVDTGKTFTSKNEGIIISSAALKVIGMPNGVGAFRKNVALDLLYPNADGTSKILKINTAVKIVGIIKDDVQPPFMIVPSGIVPESPETYERAFVRARDALGIEPLRDKLINMGFLVSTHVDLVNQAQKVMNIVTWVLGVFGITALIVSAIGMFNTMVISFLERTFEVGIMKAIGASNGDVRNLFLMESVVMGLCGGLGGVLIGTLLGEAVNLGLNILARSLAGAAAQPISLFVRPIWFMALIVGGSGLIGFFSGLLPARRATKISPKEAFIRK